MSLKPILMLLTAVSLAGFAGAGGCHRPLTAMCNQECACIRCTDFDLEECEAKVEVAAEKAASLDCSGEFQKFVDCLDDKLSCDNGVARTDKCEAEEKVLTNCTKMGNPFKTACEEAQEKTNECFGGSGGGGSDQKCEGVFLCQSKCVVNATCDEIMQGSQQFFDCFNQCGFESGSSGVGGFDDGAGGASF